MRVLFLIRWLGYGGAERQLVQLANELACRGVDVGVAVFYGAGSLERELAPGVRIFDLAKRSRRDILPFIWRLYRLIRKEKPAAVHGYTRSGNLAALVARAANRRTPVIWGVRDSNIQIPHSWPARLSDRLHFLLADFADAIIVNSRAGIQHLKRLGYPSSKLVHIPNGINTDRFHRDEAGGRRLRASWGVKESELLLGVVGRAEPNKDQETFLRAGALLAKRLPDLRLACIGITGSHPSYQERLFQLARELGIEERVMWLEPFSDVRAVYAALDILCSTSTSEGFPNVVAEAMSCETTCVVTDVGDSAYLVGGRGVVVPPGQPEAIAAGVEQILALSGKNRPRSIGSRQRIEENFSLDRFTTDTVAVLEACEKDRMTAPVPGPVRLRS